MQQLAHAGVDALELLLQVGQHLPAAEQAAAVFLGRGDPAVQLGPVGVESARPRASALRAARCGSRISSVISPARPSISACWLRAARPVPRGSARGGPCRRPFSRFQVLPALVRATESRCAAGRVRRSRSMMPAFSSSLLARSAVSSLGQLAVLLGAGHRPPPGRRGARLPAGSTAACFGLDLLAQAAPPAGARRPAAAGPATATCDQFLDPLARLLDALVLAVISEALVRICCSICAHLGVRA